LLSKKKHSNTEIQIEPNCWIFIKRRSTNILHKLDFVRNLNEISIPHVTTQHLCYCIAALLVCGVTVLVFLMA